mmetsp:Transcript_84898/g.168531  ORF Transcript_84898/g.168531 Transcript_84898/m.168531 type:complete len:186 (-) Transcript_84898:149-706(-)|eukprot:CAMPEP_0172669298 /NCGR_PEP_ID=MMETSP1074-20121228/9590_1 /TAXON_ID=2916 /ORGANISM="Ceratium fusus, Strain PA161109" /LENGTH=185 /DNA_ID=CAMNT_0013486053 /DNA_START=119 /DNA_END=676 /DNA_ORIENTATION=-
MGHCGQQLTKQRKYGKTPRTTGKVIKKDKSSKKYKTPAKLTKNITPGQVLIILAGRWRGKRVVYLKQLESGLLLVTGPFKVNGVPLRRVNQRYIIATSTKVNLGGADFSAINDDFFGKTKEAKKKKTEGAFFAAQTEKPDLSEEYKEKCRKTEDPVLKALTPDVKEYLKCPFALTRKDFPHDMKF